MLLNTPSSSVGGTAAKEVKELIPVHSVNAYLDIWFTNLGMVKDVMPLHPRKAWLPIVVSESGRMSEVRLEQL